MTTVADVMNSDPVAIEATSPVTVAAQLMKAHRIGMLPVVRDGVGRWCATAWSWVS
jgi:CBS domain-containing protein